MTLSDPTNEVSCIAVTSETHQSCGHRTSPRVTPSVRKRTLVSTRSFTHECHSSVPSWCCCACAFGKYWPAGAKRRDRLEQYRFNDNHYQRQGVIHRFRSLVRLCATGCL